MALERIQAPSGGLNVDASPDYVGLTQAPLLDNFLPGYPGKIVCRGPVTDRVLNVSASFTSVSTAWSIDDTLLLRLADGTTQQVDVVGGTATNVSGTILQVPASSAHARVVASVYGAITNAASPALGRWSGGTITVMTNAPYQFVDVQSYARRLWVLGGSVPGTTTPAVKYALYPSNVDTDPSTGPIDMSLLASWKDPVSGLVNQINYSADDAPRALATCGRFLAILGSNSINIVTGTGMSNFAVRNLTKNWGTLNLESVVEVDDGFYFMSTRGFCFCDGSTVRVVSDAAVTSALTLAALTTPIRTAAFDGGYIAVGDFYLFHPASQTWATVSSEAFSSGGQPTAVLRTATYPLAWSGRSLHRCEKITQPYTPNSVDFGYKGIPAVWHSRVARLGSPGKTATVSRVIIDYQATISPTSVNPMDSGFPSHFKGWQLALVDGAGLVYAAQVELPSGGGVLGRKRASFDVYGEYETLQLWITWPFSTNAPEMDSLAIFDAWVEFTPGRDQNGF